MKACGKYEDLLRPCCCCRQSAWRGDWLINRAAELLLTADSGTPSESCLVAASAATDIMVSASPPPQEEAAAAAANLVLLLTNLTLLALAAGLGPGLATYLKLKKF